MEERMPDPGDSPRQEAQPAVRSPLAEARRWRRVFPGHERELAPLRYWLKSLLPECPARDDVLTVANELGSNAVVHTASGQPGGWFAAEVTWYPSVVQVAVADCGGPAEPRVIDDPDGDCGRGLLVVERLSLRTGYTGGRHGRLVWAQIAWQATDPGVPDVAYDPCQMAVRQGGAALARRFAGVPAWFGRATMAWWALAGTAGLAPAPTASEFAGLLFHLPRQPHPAQPATTSRAHRSKTARPAAQAGAGHPHPARVRAATGPVARVGV
jgi:anti-sigma regulatory factor (Ser/Thr protein kinase)